MQLPPPTPMGDRTAPAPRRGHPLTTVLLGAWLLLCWAGYVAFTGDQARGGLYGCEMAYMWPTYNRVEWDGSGNERYRVYLYREAGVDPSTPMGTPVLFLPGNAGDFKQARSIASSAARLFFGDKKISAEGGRSWPKPLDFFTFDFNEDFSAFHAPTLEDQARFVVSATPHILAAYGTHAPPSRVLLLGHSMGGVVARLAALQMDNSTIDAIVTMSSPHAIPPVAFEARMDTLYTKINLASHAHPAPLLVSICGGVSDTQIVSESCALPDALVGPEDGFAVFTTDVPGVWTGVEHQTMVWCDQVRWRVARVLLDMASAVARKNRLDSARKWLLSRPAPRTTSESSWNERSVDVVSPNMSIIVQLADTTDKTLVDPPIRVEHCAGGGCTSPRTSVHAIPRPANPSDPFPFPGEGAKSRESAFVVDVYGLPVSGKLKIYAPGTFTLVGGAHEQHSVGGSWTPSDSTPVHVALRFDRPVSSVLAWRLDTTTGQCTGPPPVLHHESAAAPGWSPSHESRYYPNTSPRATLHSHISGAPFQPPVQQTHGVAVHIYQQPGCPVTRVTLSLDVPATIAKAMLRFRLAAVGWGAAWVGVFLFFQLREYRATGTVPPMSAVIETNLRPGVAIVGGTLIVAPALQHIFGLVLPKESFFLGSTQLSHIPLALLVAFWALGLVILVQRIIAVSVFVSGRFLARTPHPPSSEPKSIPRWSPASASRLLTAAALLLLVKLVIPWRMAFVVLYLIQCSVAARTSRDEHLLRHHLACSVLLLMTFLLPLTLPAIAVWGRNLWMNHGHPFAADHAILPLIPVLLVVQVCSDKDRTASVSRGKRTTTIVAQAAAALLAGTALALAPRSAYLLLHAADAVFIALAALLLE